MSAFRLAYPLGNGTYGSTHYGFATPGAAVRAAATLNPVRGARDLAPYTAVAEFDGKNFVKLVDLEKLQ